MRFGLEKQRWCFPAFGNAARLSGVVIGFDQRLFPRVPLRCVLPGCSRAAAAERDAGPYVYHPGSRRNHQMRRRTPAMLQCIAHPAEDFRISEAPATTTLVLRSTRHICVGLSRPTGFSLDRERPVSLFHEKEKWGVHPPSPGSGDPPPPPSAEISRTVSRVPSTENLTSIPANPKPYTRSGSF